MQELLQNISDMIVMYCSRHSQLIAAIDGRCASGKTTLAEGLRQRLHCNVIPMDHFFLRPHQRTPERLSEAGGNVDRERFLEEVLLPLKSGREFAYRPYSCQTQDFAEPITIYPNRITIIEGSYSCHPALWEYYDLRIFLTTSPEMQLNRLIRREGAEKAKIYQNRWIPPEESYFTSFSIAQRCDQRFET